MLRNNSLQQNNMKLTFYSNLGINLFTKRINKQLLRFKKLSRGGFKGGYFILIKQKF